METDAGGKSGKFEVEAEVKARVYALPKKDKALQRIAGGETRPVKKITQHHRTLKRMRRPYEETRQVFLAPLEEDLMRLYGKLPPAA